MRPGDCTSGAGELVEDTPLPKFRKNGFSTITFSGKRVGTSNTYHSICLMKMNRMVYRKILKVGK